ncbi:MAG: DegT/DnrJ/EryC1/StrS family aminotransferase [Cephaloticoccus sp.]|nr:DegT/DnrJ/EryC1/StrS family aminotransferase [Cephaloticoccus sp.]MCF7759532.1 DegT/DnrJ/EryC1/StrS family aminotransferase [Cephaloticoccus sp.]
MSSTLAPTAAKLALLGGTPVGKITYPKFPTFTDRAIARTVEMLRTGKLFGVGRKHVPEIGEAEEVISRYHGGRHVLATSSGHAALQSALAGLEICGGDEVITTPYTWGASISCILHQNAIPVFVDVERATGLIDPESIEAAITPRTKAILAVHIFGQPANLKRLRAIADKHKLMLIEDGSQAHGAEIDGLRVGTVGDAAGFSCMGGKILATTESGYMVTPHENVYWKGAMIGQHMGRATDGGMPEELKPYSDSLVYTYRVAPFNAVLLTEQFAKLDAELVERRRHADLLRQHLAGGKYLRLPDYAAGVKPSYHLISFTLDSATAGITRDTFAAALKAEGFNAIGYVPSPISDWPRLHWQNYQGPRVSWLSTLAAAKVDYRNLPLPNTRWRVDHALESGFDMVAPNEPMIERMAEIILKVEANIDALRDHERKVGPAAPAVRG